MSEPSTQYPKVIHFPAFINTCADMVGTIRLLTNIEAQEENARYKRGNRNNDVDNLGMRGELIAQYVCFQNNIEYQATRLIASTPLCEPDITFGRCKMDVKAIRTDATDLLVNEEAHLKTAKSITHYWFVQQLSKTSARYWVFSYDTISNWPVKKVKYSNAYYCPVSKVESA